MEVSVGNFCRYIQFFADKNLTIYTIFLPTKIRYIDNFLPTYLIFVDKKLPTKIRYKLKISNFDKIRYIL